MFAKQKRLSRGDFEGVLKGGRRRSSPNFTVVSSLEMRGYAVVVSKKTARLSLTRHRLKRRVLGALKTLSIPLPSSLILYPRASVLDLRYDDLKIELMKLISSL